MTKLSLKTSLTSNNNLASISLFWSCLFNKVSPKPSFVQNQWLTRSPAASWKAKGHLEALPQQLLAALRPYTGG